jgi:hypothetical protein
MNMPQYKAGGGQNMGNRHLHEGGFFRPCSRCGRRTFWLCEDCGRPACPGAPRLSAPAMPRVGQDEKGVREAGLAPRSGPA